MHPQGQAREILSGGIVHNVLTLSDIFFVLSQNMATIQIFDVLFLKTQRCLNLQSY